MKNQAAKYEMTFPDKYIADVLIKIEEYKALCLEPKNREKKENTISMGLEISVHYEMEFITWFESLLKEQGTIEPIT